MLKKLSTLCLMALLTACGGGYDGLDAGIVGGVERPDPNPNTNPNDPDDAKNWVYGEIGDSQGRLYLTARVFATNIYTVPEYPDKAQRTWVQLEKQNTTSNLVRKNIAIFAPQDVRCTPTCNIKITFNKSTKSYLMRQSSSGVLRPITEPVAITLYDKFSSSDTASIELPIVALDEKVNSTFNLTGFDNSKMEF